MTKTRFAPWLVFACIGTLVGCTSGDQGTAGNTELNVVIPSGSSTSGPGAPSSFDIESVEYTINCTGADFDPTTDPNIDSGPNLDQDVQINGSLEVLDTASAGVSTRDFGPELTEVYVWQGYMDIPADHACTVQLRARDAGGEVICTATEPFTVGADATVKVNVLMMCDISYQAPVGMLDLDGDFSFNIGNYCPDLFVLNCVDPDLEDLLVVPGLGAFVYSGCQVRFRDADSTCGDNCDPQTCVTTPAGLDCSPGPQPAFCNGGNAPGAPCALARCTGGDTPGAACSDDMQCQGTSPVADGTCDPTTAAGECGGTSPTPDGTCSAGPATTVICDNPGYFCANPGPAFGTPCNPAAGDFGNGDCGLPPPNPPAIPAVCAPGALMNCGGGAADPSCTYSGDTLGNVGDGPPRPLNVGPGGFLVGCTMADDDGNPNTPLAPLAPGATVTCTAQTTDGDIDCNKQKTVEVKCPGLTPCQSAPPGFCDDGNDCTADSCNDSTGVAVCVNTNVPNDTTCTSAPAPATCQAGVCTSQNCNAQPDPDGSCNDSNECTTDSCNAPPATDCSNVPNSGASCAGGTGTCNASGACIDKCIGVVCNDGNPCTDDPACDSSSGSAVCPPPVNDDNNVCDTCSGTSCVCESGVCVDGCTVPAPVDAIGIPMACRNSFDIKAVSTFPIDLENITADGCILDSQPVNFDVDPTIALDTAFLNAAAGTLCGLGTALTSATVTLAQVSVDAVAGATCTEQLAVLPGTPVLVALDATVDGTCGAGGTVTINSGVSLPLPRVTLPCTAGATGTDALQICSTGVVPLAANIDLSTPATQTFVGVSVGGGSIQVVFQCNTSSTTVPPPGTQVGCNAPNPSGQCAAIPPGNVGQTPYPVSVCDFAGGPPDDPNDCSAGPGNCFGTCTTVPVGVDPATVCATFSVQ